MSSTFPMRRVHICTRDSVRSLTNSRRTIHQYPRVSLARLQQKGICSRPTPRAVLKSGSGYFDGPTTKKMSTSSTVATDPENMYTASFAFFEAIWEAGITHCFVNLGSDHPSIIEAMVKGTRDAKGKFPRIITCPNEVGIHFLFRSQNDLYIIPSRCSGC